MAYSDTRGLPRFNAVGVGGAVLINGLLLAGFALLRPDAVPKEVWTILDTYRVQPDKPVEVQPQPREQAPKDTAITAPPLPNAPVTETPSPFTVRETGPSTFGEIPGPIAQPDPIKIDPVFVNARFDMRYKGALQPAYPPGMIRNGVEGKVTVKVLIGTDGRVKDVQAVRSDEDDFLAATRRQALNKWRFLPATRDGQPIESWREMTVSFVLPD